MIRKTIILYATLLCTTICIWAEENILIDGIYYMLDTKKQTAGISFDEDYELELPADSIGSIRMDTLIIPATIKHNKRSYRVTWGNNSGLLLIDKPHVGTLVVGENFESIYESLFSGFDNVHTIVWHSSKAYCEEDTYLPVSTRAVIFGEKVRFVPANLCVGMSNLQSVTLPKKLTAIGARAFYGCSALTSINIPEGITTIGDEAFCYCYKLENLSIPSSAKDIASESFIGVLNVNIPRFYYVFANGRVYGWDKGGKLYYDNDEHEIAEYIGSYAVNGYGEYPFVYADSCKFELLGCSPSIEGKVVVPDSVCYIGQFAFESCKKLESVTISKSIKAIDEKAFVGVQTIRYSGSLPGAPWGAKTAVKE